MSRISVSAQPTLSPTYQLAASWLSPRAEQSVLLGALSLLCLFASTFFNAVFDEWSAWFPRVVMAAVVSYAVALLDRRRQLSTAEGVVAQIVASILVLPGLLGLPGARFGLPLPVSLLALAKAVSAGPARLITSPIPARAEAELLVAPVVGLWVGFALASALTSSKSSRWSIAGPLLSLAVAIGCGPRDGVAQLLPGALFLALSLLFVVFANVSSATRQHTYRSTTAIGTMSRRVAVLLAVVILAALFGPALSGRDRFSLRDLRTPPFNPAELPSPLAEFRKYRQPKNRDVPLFTFTGARQSRWALAVLPTYDGRVWSAGSADDVTTGRFEPIGARIRRSSDFPGKEVRTTSITIDGLREPWLPTPGLALDARMSLRDQQDVRHNPDTGSLVLTRTTSKNTTYEISWVDIGTPTPLQLADAGFGPSLGALLTSTLTARIGSKASEFTKDSTTAWQKVTALQAGLQDGYWNERTAPGHSIGELSRMVASRETLQGNDEHYAALFAVMARSLDIPARVVVGFAPDLKVVEPNAAADVRPVAPSANPNAIYGRDIHAWAEVNMGQLGWVPVDIRIDPRKKPKPKESQSVSEADQASTPPNRVPSPEPPEPQRQQTKKPERAKPAKPATELPRALIVGVLAVTIPIVLVSSVVAAIAGIKSRRRRQRRSRPDPSQAIAGAWEELLDSARETGLRVPPSLTVSETAARIESVKDGTDVSMVTALVERAAFHPDEPTANETQEAWTVVERTVASWHEHLTRWQRLRLLASTATFRQGALR